MKLNSNKIDHTGGFLHNINDLSSFFTVSSKYYVASYMRLK